MFEVMMTTVFEKSASAAAAVREAAVVEHLEQQVEHVRVRLLDLVEEEHAVRPAARGLREEAALLAVHVAGGRADEPLRHVPLHELAHVEARERGLVVEEELRERLAQLRLADAARPEEQERADGLARIAEAHAAAPHRAGDRAHGLVLADDALAERSSILRSFSASPSSILETGMPVQSLRVVATSFSLTRFDASVEMPSRVAASSAAARRRLMSGIVTCSSSPIFAKLLSFFAVS
jgi:hypothetical protein